MIVLNQLKSEAAKSGFAIGRCSEHHLQVCDENGPLVNVWPSTGKFLSFFAKQGVKSRSGDVGDIIALAAEESMKRNPRRVAVEFAPPPDIDESNPFDDDPTPSVAQIDRLARDADRPAKKPPEEKRERRYKHLLHLALLRLQLQPGKLNDALVSEIYEVL